LIYSTGSGLLEKKWNRIACLNHCDVMILSCSLQKYHIFSQFCNGHP